MTKRKKRKIRRSLCTHEPFGKGQGLAFDWEPLPGGKIIVRCPDCGKRLGYAVKGLGGTIQMR